MTEQKITVLDKGPLYVRGPVEMYDAAGNRFETGPQCTLCRCGLSQKAPFCDGSHRMSNFDSRPRAMPTA